MNENGGFRGRVGKVWREGKTIHVVVTAKDGRRLVDLPLTVVVVGGVLAPWALAIGVVVAVVVGARLETERTDGPIASEGAPEPLADAPGGVDDLAANP